MKHNDSPYSIITNMYNKIQSLSYKIRLQYIEYDYHYINMFIIFYKLKTINRLNKIYNHFKIKVD